MVVGVGSMKCEYCRKKATHKFIYKYGTTVKICYDCRFWAEEAIRQGYLDEGKFEVIQNPKKEG